MNSEMQISAQQLSNFHQDVVLLKNTLAGMSDIIDALSNHTVALDKYNKIAAANAFLNYLSFTSFTKKEKEEMFRKEFGDLFDLDEEFVRNLKRSDQSSYTGDFKTFRMY